MAETITIVGAGVIGEAVAKCLSKSPYQYRIIATRRRTERLDELKSLGVEVTQDNAQAAKQANIIFICVKPRDVAGILKEIASEIQGKLVISTAAIISLDFYDKAVPGAKFVRTMPNVAAFVGESFTAYSCNSRITDDDRSVTKRLLDTMGQHQEVEERFIDAITGLSGSGPAFIAIVIEALMYAGLKVGLPRELSIHSCAQAVLGTAKLILDGEMNTSQIKNAVTTPGGTTIEGIYQLEDGKLRTTLINAVVAATEKCTSIRDNWNNRS